MRRAAKEIYLSPQCEVIEDLEHRNTQIASEREKFGDTEKNCIYLVV